MAAPSWVPEVAEVQAGNEDLAAVEMLLHQRVLSEAHCSVAALWAAEEGAVWRSLEACW